MSEEKLIEAKFKPGDIVSVSESDGFFEGAVGTIVDLDKWSNKRTSYFICTLRDLGGLEREAYKERGDSFVDVTKMLGLSKWSSEENLTKISFKKLKWYQKYSYVFKYGLSFMLGLGSYYAVSRYYFG